MYFLIFSLKKSICILMLCSTEHESTLILKHITNTFFNFLNFLFYSDSCIMCYCIIGCSCYWWCWYWIYYSEFMIHILVNTQCLMDNVSMRFILCIIMYHVFCDFLIFLLFFLLFWLLFVIFFLFCYYSNFILFRFYVHIHILKLFIIIIIKFIFSLILCSVSIYILYRTQFSFSFTFFNKKLCSKPSIDVWFLIYLYSLYFYVFFLSFKFWFFWNFIFLLLLNKSSSLLLLF